METRRDVIVGTAVLADEPGYEIFAVPEGWGLDPAPVLTEIALRTATIYCPAESNTHGCTAAPRAAARHNG
jgi:hypothetical protein